MSFTFWVDLITYVLSTVLDSASVAPPEGLALPFDNCSVQKSLPLTAPADCGYGGPAITVKLINLPAQPSPNSLSSSQFRFCV
jgi:hypothetical protein